MHRALRVACLLAPTECYEVHGRVHLGDGGVDRVREGFLSLADVLCHSRFTFGKCDISQTDLTAVWEM